MFPVTVVAESNYPDGTREVVTGSHSHRSTSRVGSDGAMSHQFEGRPARNEEDVLQACESLMEALRSRGLTFNGKFRIPDGQETGIDATATTFDGEVINVQVVGVRQQDLLAQLGRTGAASSAATPDELADDVCSKVKAKRDVCPPNDRPGVVLLIDAIRSPGHTFPAVIDSLRASPRVDILQTTGYRAVWLAGPTTSLTQRLDAEPQEVTDRPAS